MPAYASTDAEHLTHGIRLGGRGHLLDNAPAGKPLDMETLERLTRADIYEPGEDGEDAGYLDKLAKPRPEGYTLAEIEAFAAGVATT